MKLIDKLKPARGGKAVPSKNEAAAVRLRDICSAAEDEALRRMESRTAGLTSGEVESRL